jgi:hypothetical protein
VKCFGGHPTPRINEEGKEKIMSAQRIAVIGRLKPGSLERAEEIIVEHGPPFELDEAGLARHSVFLSSDSVVFVFEGPNVERVVGRLVDDPAVSGSFSVWGPVLDGTPQLAHERFFWELPTDAGA